MGMESKWRDGTWIRPDSRLAARPAPLARAAKVALITKFRQSFLSLPDLPILPHTRQHAPTCSPRSHTPAAATIQMVRISTRPRRKIVFLFQFPVWKSQNGPWLFFPNFSPIFKLQKMGKKGGGDATKFESRRHIFFGLGHFLVHCASSKMDKNAVDPSSEATFSLLGIFIHLGFKNTRRPDRRLCLRLLSFPQFHA